uniref:Uncharacterized protein n=1 Tax=Pyxicephalus adspersus TaxID=30357 RepID=A0AAV2ZTZ1_PYXAD|nr:TPA: hypothetical protein GDO54_013027 [Pyxicephalus adspersus]
MRRLLTDQRLGSWYSGRGAMEESTYSNIPLAVRNIQGSYISLYRTRTTIRLLSIAHKGFHETIQSITFRTKN